jgi:NAD(P)-dependent dehydrogenase (short-subunit alcohol dehydrogenase family)
MTTTFITGANRSLGHETARRLLEAGHTVVLGARDPERGRAAADALGARFVQIDVTDDASVAAAVADVTAHEGAVDVLVNNAGVNQPYKPADELTAADAAGVFDVNVIGVVRVTQAFLPLLRASANPVIVNVSSGMGYFAVTHDPDRVESTFPAPLYTASKSADHAHHAVREGVAGHQGQRGRPRLHRDRVQRAQRPADRHRGDRRHRRPRHDRRRRTDGSVPGS